MRYVEREMQCRIANRLRLRGTPFVGLVFALFLLAHAASPQTTVADRWVDHRVFVPFVCHSDFPLAGQQQLFADLAQIQQELVQRLGIPPARERIEIYLFRSAADYRRYVKRQFPKLPFRRALFVKDTGPGTVLAYRGPEMDVDVRHESTHALLHASLPMVPLWLDEGLAEYFEVPADKRAFDNPHHSSTIWQMRLGIVPRLASLETKHKLHQMGRAEYRNSWAWAHFLLQGPAPARAELVRFFADIRGGTPPGKLSERLTRHMPDIEGRLVQHFKTFRR